MDYTSLKANIADWLNRDDLTAVIPTFITLAQAELDTLIKHWRREVRSVTTLDARYISLPIDWRETIRIEVTEPNFARLDLSTSGQISDLREQTGNHTGCPRNYAHVGGALELFPTPSGAFPAELHYTAKLPVLSDAAPTNWLLDLHPGCYLYGALLAASPYLKDDERIAIWGALYKSAVDIVNEDGERSKMSGTGLRIKPKGWTS